MCSLRLRGVRPQKARFVVQLEMGQVDVVIAGARLCYYYVLGVEIPKVLFPQPGKNSCVAEASR